MFMLLITMIIDDIAVNMQLIRICWRVNSEKPVVSYVCM